MAQVPYQPFSTAQPTGGGERISINTPGAAFGENIGAALRQMGSTEEQAGGELFQRAMAMQQLNNENEARDLQLKFAQQSATQVANYDALTGKAARDGLVPHLTGLGKIRDNIADSASNPMVRRMFQNDSAPFIQREIFSAARHAGDENRKYTIDSLNSDATLAIQNTAQHTDDEGYVNDQRAKIASKVQTAAFIKYGTQDPNDPNVKLAVDNALSAQRSEQILSKAKTDAVTAQQWFQKYSSDLTNPADMMRVQSQIENHAAVVAAANVANKVVSAHRQPDGTFDATAKQMEQEVRDAAAKAVPGNDLAPDTAVAKLQGFLWHEQFFIRQEQQDAKNQLNDLLAKGDIRDAQSLMAYPGMDKVIEKLPMDMRTAPQLQGYMNRFYAAEDKITNERARVTINGMKYSDPAAFMAIDPTDPKYHLNKNDIITIQNDQAKLARQPSEDPRVQRALSWIKGARVPQLQALGIASRDKNNPDDYDHFVGTLQEALQEWQQDNKRAPTYEEVVDKIAPTILKTQTFKPGAIFGGLWGSQVPAFTQFERPTIEDIPGEFREKLTKDVLAKGGAQPTDQQMVQAWARTQFLKLYKSQQAEPK